MSLSVETAASRAVEHPMRPALHRVVTRSAETDVTVTLELEPLEAPLPRGAPGQFNMVWAWGVGEVPISSSALPDSGRLVHTIRDVGGVTHALCSAKPGTVLGVRGPFGHGWDLDGARGRDVVVVAGGIGLAPLRPVVHALLARRADFGGVSLVVGARATGELLFHRELDGWWRERRITVRTIVDRPSPGWLGSVGVVTNELPRVAFDPARTVAMICGPEIMMRFVAAHLAHRGVAPGDIHLSMERNMQCALRQCGHCQLAGSFVCADGPVLGWDVVQPLVAVPEL